MFGTVDAFKSAADQIFAALHEYLDGHVIRDQIMIDQMSAEIKIRLAGGGKANFDFLEAHFNQRIPHADFAVGAHGFDEALVTIAQIHATPNGRGGDLGGRPSAVWQIDGREGAVFLGGIDHHNLGSLLSWVCSMFVFPKEPRRLRPADPQGQLRRRRSDFRGRFSNMTAFIADDWRCCNSEKVPSYLGLRLRKNSQTDAEEKIAITMASQNPDCESAHGIPFKFIPKRPATKVGGRNVAVKTDNT